jgi:hypothetical protein
VATIFANLLPLGFVIGEVNAYQDFVRYQGLLGDSVKILLLLFVFWAALARNIVLTLIFTLALLISGGRLGIAGLVIGSGIVALERDFRPRVTFIDRKRLIAALAVIGLVFVVGLRFNVGGIRTRLSEVRTGSSMPAQVATWSTAVRIFAAGDNPFFGVGYGGYRLFAPDYETRRVLGRRIRAFDYDTFSQLLKSAVDAGALGVIVFLWLMLNLTRTLRAASRRVEGEVATFFRAGYIWITTLFALSPFGSWFLPESRVSYLVCVMVGAATAVLLERRAESFAPAPAVAPVPIRRFL